MGSGECHGQFEFDDGPLAVKSRRIGDAMVVSISGEVDMLTAPQLFPWVEQCLADGECRMLVVDLVEVMFLGSSGLKVLLDVRDFAETRGLPFRLVAADNHNVIRPLELTGLAKILTTYPTVDEALDDSGAAEGVR